MKLALTVLSIVLVAVLLAIAWSEENPEWANYQRVYFDLAQRRAQSSTQADWYRTQRVEIRQISVAPLKRVDRCTTCHLAVADPNFADAPEPLRLHSALLQSHPPERFGCTVCHRGEGRAVTTLTAHGEVPGSSVRMLRGEYVQAACYLCHAEKTLPPAATSEIVAGEIAINQLRCLRCHQIDGMGESEGPDLSAIGSRRDALELDAHLLNPPAMNSGSTMPIFPITRAQAQAITVYLLTQQGDAPPANDVRYRSANFRFSIFDFRLSDRKSKFENRKSDGVLAPIVFFRYDGQQLFWAAGCGVCHRIGNEGGAVGPALTRIGRVRERDWLRRYLSDPSAVRPDGRMPQLYLNDREIDALVEFLLTLR
jgi:cbb3-type cytochrome oxidase cytochrome c subunit